MPATERRRWTAAEVRALPEEPGRRFQVVDGELLVSPGPSWPHQAAVFELTKLLDHYLKSEGVGFVLNGPADIQPDDYTLVQPDIFAVPPVDGRRPREWTEASQLILVVEVLSPGTARHDRVIKRRHYSRMNVEYWIVDLDARLVERWVPGASGPEVPDESLEWRAMGASSTLKIDLAAMFAEVLGGE